MLKFNLSPSSINMYKKSQLEFFYTYLMKADSDTKVVECYGKAGSVVHNFLEYYAKLDSPFIPKGFQNKFKEMWNNQKLNILKGINGKSLSFLLYLNAASIGMKLLDKVYQDIIPEETIKWVIHNDENYYIECKGIIDVQAILRKTKEKVIMDYKTSSKVDNGENFIRQGKHYALAVYKKYGYIPKKVIFEYLKIAKNKEYIFSKEDLDNYENEIIRIKNEIISKGTDIIKYELGDFDHIFNQHYKKCLAEKNKRENIIIKIKIYKNRIYLSNINNTLRIIIDKKYSYTVKGCEWSPLFQSGDWDGKKHFLFKNNSLPYGFLNSVIKLINDYSIYTKVIHKIEIVNLRNNSFKSLEIPFKNSDIKLRDYQDQAVEEAIQKKVGILALGTGSGKTFISAELIKRINTKTLFLVNRIELADQTKEQFEKYLGVPIGLMTEGNIDTNSNIVIASIQTLYAIINRDPNKLIEYLNNIKLCIYDEAQNLKNSGIYGEISKHINNCDYFIGLSGSPWRNDEKTLEMNAMVGFPIYTYTTEQLELDGWIVPTKTYFISYEKISDYTGTYHEVYADNIVNNIVRNEIISYISNQYKNKRKVLILTKLVKHAHLLNELIPNSIVITGTTPKKYRKEMFKKFKKEDGIVLIGSIKIFSSGIDIPDLDILINASAHKSSVDSIQSIGRVKRKSEGKKYGYFIDFVDKYEYLLKATKERKMILQSHGNKIKTIKDYKIINFE